MIERIKAIAGLLLLAAAFAAAMGVFGAPGSAHG